MIGGGFRDRLPPRHGNCIRMNFKFGRISNHLQMVRRALLDSFDSSFEDHPDVLELHVREFFQKQQDMNNRYECQPFESMTDKIYNHHDIEIHVTASDI